MQPFSLKNNILTKVLALSIPFLFACGAFGQEIFKSDRPLILMLFIPIVAVIQFVLSILKRKELDIVDWIFLVFAISIIVFIGTAFLCAYISGSN